MLPHQTCLYSSLHSILSLIQFLQNLCFLLPNFLSWPIQSHMAFVSNSSPCTTTNLTSFSSPPPPCSPCPVVCPFLSVSFPTRKKGCSIMKACASISPSNGPSAAGAPDGKLPNGNLPKGRREILLEYVRNVQPDFMELFTKKASQQVVDAMRQTVANMIGSLPPQFFAVTVTTVAENLAQLMYSVMMTGYMFKNAQNRLELQQSLEQVALPDVTDKKIASDYAAGTQKNVTGEVIKWNNISGPEKIDAVKYIELLEAEIEELNRQVARKSAAGQNVLLEYLKSLEPQNLKDLTSSAGEDVVLAMNTFIKRLLAASDPQMKTTAVETSAPELANVLYWLMVVGYSLRNIEVRFDMERVLGAPPKLAELPPGENI